MTGDTQGTPAQAPGASSCADTGLGTAGTATGTTAGLAGLAGTAGPATSPSTEDPRDFRKALSFLPPPAGSESKRGAGSNRKNNSVSQGHRYFSGAQIIAR